MSIIENLYHGTTLNFPEFRPFSHFGTKEVALDAIARKIVDKCHEQAVLMKVRLYAPEEEVIELEDWGNPNCRGLASALKWSSQGEERKLYQEILNDISAKAQCDRLWNENGFKVLNKLLRSKNISVLKYKNFVEGSGISISYCAIDPKSIEIVSNESVSMGHLEEYIAKWNAFNENFKIS